MNRVEAALAAFNPAAWPVHVVTDAQAVPAPDGPAIIVIHDANDPALDGIKRRFIELGIVGGTRPSWIGATAPPPLPTLSDPVRVVSFYTRATRYETYADRLRASLDRQGVDHALVGLDVPGSWEMVCAVKAEFIRDQWRATDRSVVWLDADSTLETPLGMFAAPGADFAVHKHGGWKFASGSILFGRGAAAEALLDRWVLRCQADPLMWDQNHLDAAWADVSATMPLVTRWLPPAYCAIFDSHDPARFGLPVVLQHQASRGEAKAGRKQQPTPARPDALRAARHASRWVRGAGSQFGSAAAQSPAPVSQPLAAQLRVVAEDGLPVVQVGFGAGLVAGAFTAGEFIGADIRPEAVLAARRAMPEHTWRLLMEEHPYPTGGTVLLLDVLGALADASVATILAHAAAAAPRLMVCEAAGHDITAQAIAAGWTPLSHENAVDGWAIRLFARA